MKNQFTPYILEECDPAIAEAITRFVAAWDSYRDNSKRYSIYTLMKKIIDPAWVLLRSKNEILSDHYIRFSFMKNASLSNIKFDYKTSITCLTINSRYLYLNFHKLDSLSEIAKNNDFSLAERFMHSICRLVCRGTYGTHNQYNLKQTLETLQYLLDMCSLKVDIDHNKGRGIENIDNINKHNRFCKFCGENTELFDYMKNSDWRILYEEDHPNLSYNYCKKHKPNIVVNGNNVINNEYTRCNRSFNKYKSEVSRLYFQYNYGIDKLAPVPGDLYLSIFYWIVLLMRGCFVEWTGINEKFEVLKYIRSESRILIDNKMDVKRKRLVSMYFLGMSRPLIIKNLGIKKQNYLYYFNSIDKKYIIFKDYKMRELCTKKNREKLLRMSESYKRATHEAYIFENII